MTAASQAARSRAEINRLNAKKSTGPRTAAGKERVKFNALKHGQRARTLILPGEDGDAFRARLEAWTEDLGPRDEAERFLVARAVEVSWKIERVERARAARRDARRYADADRLAAQAEEVVALGRRLFWDPIGPLPLYPHPGSAGGEPQRISYSGDPEDPDDPARLVVRLEASALGCAWIVERWDELRGLLEEGLPWQPPDRLKAIRMLGRQPLDAVDDRRVMAIYLCCWAMDPDDQYGFTDLISELAPEERRAYLERLNAREPMRDMPASLDDARAELLALIAAEEERLEAALAGHLERAEAEAEADLAFDDSAWGERLRRYEQSNDKTLLRIIETLRRRQGDAGGTGSPRGRRSASADESAPIGTLTEVSPKFLDQEPARSEPRPDEECPPGCPVPVVAPPIPEPEARARDSAGTAIIPQERVAGSAGVLLAALLALFVSWVCAGSTTALAASIGRIRPYLAPATATKDRSTGAGSRNTPPPFRVLRATHGGARVARSDAPG